MGTKIELPYAYAKYGYYRFRYCDKDKPLPPTFTGHILIYTDNNLYPSVFNTYIDHKSGERAWEVSKDYAYKPRYGIVKLN